MLPKSVAVDPGWQEMLPKSVADDPGWQEMLPGAVAVDLPRQEMLPKAVAGGRSHSSGGVGSWVERRALVAAVRRGTKRARMAG